MGDADLAGEQAALRADLERVAIDEHDRALRRDEQIPLVDVADDVRLAVDRVEHGGAVHRHVDEKRPIAVGKLQFAMGRTVQVVDGNMPVDARKHGADDRAFPPLVQRLQRPGGEGRQVGRRQVDHRAEFVGLVGGDSLVIHFGDVPLIAGELENSSFAARSKFVRPRRAVGRACQSTWTSSPIRVARIKVLSSSVRSSTWGLSRKLRNGSARLAGSVHARSGLNRGLKTARGRAPPGNPGPTAAIHP